MQNLIEIKLSTKLASVKFVCLMILNLNAIEGVKLNLNENFITGNLFNFFLMKLRQGLLFSFHITS